MVITRLPILLVEYCTQWCWSTTISSATCMWKKTLSWRYCAARYLALPEKSFAHRNYRKQRGNEKEAISLLLRVVWFFPGAVRSGTAVSRAASPEQSSVPSRKAYRLEGERFSRGNSSSDGLPRFLLVGGFGFVGAATWNHESFQSWSVSAVLGPQSCDGKSVSLTLLAKQGFSICECIFQAVTSPCRKE